MRTAALALIVLATATATAPAQAWAEKMFKDGAVHDFGNVPRGTQMHHRFAITNIYKVRMEISSVTSGCGCVTAAATKKILEPLETSYIEVNMDSKRFIGAKSVVVRVTVGPEFVSTADLRVSAFSRGDIVCNPSQINFGTVAHGIGPTLTLDIEYAGALEWQITDVAAKDVPVKATVKELYRRPGQVGYQLQVTLNTDAPPGPVKHDLFLKTNDPASPMVPVLVEAVVQASISATPTKLSIAGAKVGETLTRRVVVRATRPFLVTAVEGLTDDLSLGSDLGGNPAMVHILTFKLKPVGAGDFKREVRIKTDQQDATVVVTINGTAVQ